MKAASRRHSSIRALAPHRAQRRKLSALDLRWATAPERFSDREDDAAEYASLLRQFELAHDDSLGVERFH
jgi:hypothetical protein